VPGLLVLGRLVLGRVVPGLVAPGLVAPGLVVLAGRPPVAGRPGRVAVRVALAAVPRLARSCC
jgi:hypothetical protein